MNEEQRRIDDLQYMAHVFDCEGCVDIFKHINRSTGTYSYIERLKVTMVDSYPIKLYAYYFGGKPSIRPNLKTVLKRSLHEWSLAGSHAVIPLKTMMPICRLKGDQMRVVLGLQDIKNKYGRINRKYPKACVDEMDALYWIARNMKRVEATISPEFNIAPTISNSFIEPAPNTINEIKRNPLWTLDKYS